MSHVALLREILLYFCQIVACDVVAMSTQIIFKDQQEFIQSAFNKIAQIVSEHGQPCLEAFVPAFSTEQCLEHLALVASEWAYDYSVIDAYGQTYKIANQELKEEMGDC
ncbi:hypothetical protein [Acinetobacter bereziniae]|uniref:hypothetical protein n=2 Tax=Acinetobacter TaxID=469 RepID=UPI0026D7C4DC